MKCVLIPVTHYQQNCSLVWCEKTRKAAVIDPGGDLDQIHAAISAHNVEVEAVLLTHGHFDHAGGAQVLADALSVPIIGPHIGDKFWLDQLPEQAAMMGFNPNPAFSPQQWLEDGEQVKVGEETLEVYHCPGHTPGHVVFVNKTVNLAWVGDVIFKGSIGRTDFPKGDHETLVNSIRQKLWPLGDDIQFVPGHGPMSSFAHEKQTNPFVADKKFG